jgi:hypothetical protein
MKFFRGVLSAVVAHRYRIVRNQLTDAGGVLTRGLTRLPPRFGPLLAPPLLFGPGRLPKDWFPPPRPLPRAEFCWPDALAWGAGSLAPVNPPDLPPEVSRIRSHLLRTCA